MFGVGVSPDIENVVGIRNGRYEGFGLYGVLQFRYSSYHVESLNGNIIIRSISILGNAEDENCLRFLRNY